MADVGHVILNRVERRQKSLKEVVTAPKQFSCFNSGTEKPVSDTKGMIKTLFAMLMIFSQRLEGFYTSADHYHRFDVDPYWDDDMEYLGQIGDHQFFDSGKRRN